MPEMTRGQALATLLGRFRVHAKVVSCDYDPAGSTTEYVPDPASIAIVQPFIDRTLTEDDFYFHVGCGPTPTHYTLCASVIREIESKYV